MIQTFLSGRSKFWVTLALWIWIAPVLAQSYSFIQFGVDKGLTASQVQTIQQGPDGNLWIGTLEGLIRYDGQVFEKFSSENLMAEDWVTAIHIVDSGIWLGHWGGSVSYLDRKTGDFISHPFEDYSDFNQINDILEDGQGKIWIATQGAGVFSYNPHDDSVDPNPLPKGSFSRNVTDLEFDADGKLWLGTDDGLVVYDLSNAGISQSLKLSDELPGKGVNTLNLLTNSDMLVGTNEGGVIIKTRGNAVSQEGFIYLKNERKAEADMVTCAIEDAEQNIWLGTPNGLCRYGYNDGRYDQCRVYSEENGLNYTAVNTLIQDRENNLWIGTDLGLNLFRGETFRIIQEKDGIANNIVWAVYEDSKRNMWLGTYKGVSRLSPDDQHPTGYKIANFEEDENGLAGRSVISIFEDRDGNMWFGTSFHGVSQYIPTENRFVHYDSIGGPEHSVYCINQDVKGNLLFGTRHGAAKLDPTTGEWSRIGTESGLGGRVIYRIFRDSQDRIWFAALGGDLSMVNGAIEASISKEDFYPFRETDGLKHKFIHSMTEDGLKNIWIGTYNGGLYKYDGKEFLNFRGEHGLSSNTPFSLLADADNEIWIGTNKGLDRFNPEQKTFRHYGKEDGFMGVEANSDAICKDYKGNIWVGTIMGVLCYAPLKDKPNIEEPITRIVNVKQLYEDIGLPEDMEFSFTENHITIEYLGISLTNPEKIQYRHRLKNVDKDWTPATKDAKAVYPNLGPGKYTFEVVAMNNNGVWNNEPATWSFVIAPPFWRTWWFFVLLFFLAVAIVLMADRFRTKNLMDAKKILEDKVQHRTQELDQKNQELAYKNRNITDSIKYAKRIQDAILPSEITLKSALPQSFVYYKPKDIVSGDFYWVQEFKGRIWVAVVDSTGHGVPGAFLSILGYNGLNRALKEFDLSHPNEVLNKFNSLLEEALWYKDEIQKDGMDIGLIALDRSKGTLEYAGANIPLHITRSAEVDKKNAAEENQKVTMPADTFKLIEVKSDTHSVGTGTLKKSYKNNVINLHETDTVYLFTNGFSDQFGGDRGKKFKVNRLKQLLLYNQDKNLQEQGVLLAQTFDEWRGDLEQIDDVCMLGLRWTE